MATNSSKSKEALLCPQCNRLYDTPVKLDCEHNFCQDCVKTFWKWKRCKNCPVCGVPSTTHKPPINLKLKLEVDKYQEERTNSSRGVCLQHNEELKLFCFDDEEPICLVCQLSTQHKVHDCSPVDEAARNKKADVSTRLVSLRKKLTTLLKTLVKWREMKSFIQTQAQENEEAIKKEFEKLHQFLLEEERSRLEALQREKETKTQLMSRKLESIKVQIETLQSAIDDVETALLAPDVPFLQEYKQTKASVTTYIPEPEVLRDVLINSAQNLGSLKYEVWKNMLNTVKYVPVILDPNTAHSNLALSADLSSLQYAKKQMLPENAERFTGRLCVLGATGFKTGKHRWSVDVGRSKSWCVGVALESIKRQSTVFLKPAEGFWVISLCEGDSLCAETSPRTKLATKQKPEKITVELDCDKGKVVFINATNSTTIHTFKNKFTEKVFPYFSPGLSDSSMSLSSLTICQSEVKIHV